MVFMTLMKPLRLIRVEYKQELKDRILLGIQEINAEPVVHCWKKLDFAKNNTQAFL